MPQALRKSLGNLVANAAATLPPGWAQGISGASLIVPYYHMVSDEVVPHVSHLYRFRTIKEFTADVEFLARHFRPVTLGDIVDALDGKRALPPACFHLTFDDGFREMHDVVAPILHRTGVPASFFINTAFIDGGGLAHHNVLSLILHTLEQRREIPESTFQRLESLLPASETQNLRQRILAVPFADRGTVSSMLAVLEISLPEYIGQKQPYLSSDQIRGLIKQGFSIGAHSHDHPLYAAISLDEQVAQTRTSMEFLTSRFGVKPKAFAFPHTDTGVKESFFSTVFSEQIVDISFGTGGLVPHFHPRNIERFTMEKTAAGAREILARQFARATYHRLRRERPRAQFRQPAPNVI